jgi:hypothetical protein
VSGPAPVALAAPAGFYSPGLRVGARPATESIRGALRRSPLPHGSRKPAILGAAASSAPVATFAIAACPFGQWLAARFANNHLSSAL